MKASCMGAARHSEPSRRRWWVRRLGLGEPENKHAPPRVPKRRWRFVSPECVSTGRTGVASPPQFKIDGFRSEGGVNNRHDWLELTIEWTPAVFIDGACTLSQKPWKIKTADV